MNQYGHIPPELMERVRSMSLALFGGPDKLDCWLTRTADALADAGNPAIRPIRLDPSMIPPEFQSLMHRPREVVDLLLDRLDALSIFGYTTKIIQADETYLAIVSDQASGHVIEETAGPDPDTLTRALMERYGPNLEIVKE